MHTLYRCDCACVEDTCIHIYTNIYITLLGIVNNISCILRNWYVIVNVKKEKLIERNIMKVVMTLCNK